MSPLRVPMTLREGFWSDPFFSSNWVDFDQFREEMLRDSQEVWKTMAIDHSNKDGKQGATSAAAPPPSIRNLLRSMSMNSADHAVVDDQLIKLRDDENCFQLSVDAHSYKPDQIKVTVEGADKLKIEGKHEEKSEDGSKYVSKQFVRIYTLPRGCTAESVTSNLSADGVLMVTAPKGKEAP